MLDNCYSASLSAVVVGRIRQESSDYVHKPVILARSIAEAVAFRLILAGSVAKEVALEKDGGQCSRLSEFRLTERGWLLQCV
jgi:hypothetical protein